MAAVMLQFIHSFYTYYSKNSLFSSANTYEKYNVSKEYCIARHDDKICFLPKCRYHIILIGNIKELLQKLGAFCFNNEHVDCLYTLFKHRFGGKIVLKSDNLQMAVQFNQQKRSGQNAEHCEKEILVEKVQKIYVEFLPRDQFDAN